MSTSEQGHEGRNEGEQYMEDMLIPEYLLDGKRAHTHEKDAAIPSFPMLVFVNKKSGGQLGSQIIPHLQVLLHPKQIHELPKEDPAEVLAEFLGHLDDLERDGDKVAAGIRARLRLVVAGGDGTHGWLLGAVADLRLEHLPPVATIPLGTGNNLPFSFGWGKKNPATSVEAMREILLKATEARPIQADRWHVVIRMSKAVEDSPLKKVTISKNWSKLRNLIQVASFQPIPDNNENFQSGRHSYQGGFWNYLSIGMDSQVSYGFHTMRQEHPEKFKNQLQNQSRYAELACTQGWFCASCLHPRSKNIKTLANIFIAKYDGEWHKLDISPRIRSILLMNLPSFSGGLNPWGTPGTGKQEKRGLTAPYVNDGLIEVVGFRDAWHGMALLFPHGHGIRLAQAHKLKIEFHKGGVDHTYMRVDGEPWLQHLPSDDKPTVMEITHKGQAVVLAYGECVAEPIPQAIAERAKLPISFAAFDAVQHEQTSQAQDSSSGRNRNTSVKERKNELEEENQFMKEETPPSTSR